MQHGKQGSRLSRHPEPPEESSESGFPYPVTAYGRQQHYDEDERYHDKEAKPRSMKPRDSRRYQKARQNHHELIRQRKCGCRYD